ncbi:PREDICTED: uncharacterized protein LOC104815026 [Tarenaya hassleriana]|uniref:uncharacterized protein LOC104815026 n=1 Tax=Tarenaya hassleriana TaxID=28532 RepID=UPI00053C1308|nr:PREDICTED: uncharacterized protein LOC104815026 [Tarenaya hassleriana]
MGKPTGKKKNLEATKASDSAGVGKLPGKASDHRTAKIFDEDTEIFISRSQELKDEGNKLFQKREYDSAKSKYEKALKLLPKNHIDVASLRTNMAACYMQMGLGEYPNAINECNLALEASPRYSKALLKRARCYEALNKLDLAFRDTRVVLNFEPNNLSANDMFERVRNALVEKGVDVDELTKNLVNVQPVTRSRKSVKEDLKKKKKKKEQKVEKEEREDVKERGEEKVEEKKLLEDNAIVREKKKPGKKKPVDKAVVTEKKARTLKDKEVITTKNAIGEAEEVTKGVNNEEKSVARTVKLVLGEDIRWAQLPMNSSIRLVRDIIRDRFPGLKGVLVKYRDPEGDLVTITTTDELRLAESSGDSGGSLRLYIAEVSPDQEPAYDGVIIEEQRPSSISENWSGRESVESEKGSPCIEDWVVQFARVFKNHVGFDSDSYLDLHELGMKFYSEAMEDTVTCEDAQELFDIAADKFQEMAALAMFNWGNVHMSKARKRVLISEDGSKESILNQIKSAFEWTQQEYGKAATKYEEALKIKPDFYEALLALGQQQFEQAKLCWYYATGNKTHLESGPSQEVLQLYNRAEDSMERGMQMWEEMVERRLNGLSKHDNYKSQLQKMGFDTLIKEAAAEEFAMEQGSNMSSQIYLLWGTLLYERSIVEYRLGLLTWEECLEVAVEKFELAGASPTDIAVMIKNHCSNETTHEGMGFKIDEIVQAWNEMYDAKRWQIGVPSFRLEPLFRRRVPKLQHVLEHISALH